MEGDELLEVRTVLQAQPPEQTVFSGVGTEVQQRTCGAESALPHAENRDGRHRQVTLRYCRWLFNTDTATFSSTLKLMFLFLLLLESSLGFYVFTANGFEGWIYALGRVFGVISDGLNITIALFASLVAFCVDLEKPGLKPTPFLVRLAKWTGHKVKEHYYKTTTQPHNYSLPTERQ